MQILPKLLYFIAVNALGFMSVGLCYFLGMKTGALDLSDPSFDVEAFRKHFVAGTMTTWLICALFSFLYFFIQGKIRLAFLWAPVVIPFVYGLSVMFGLSL